MNDDSPVKKIVNKFLPYKKSHPILFQIGMGLLLIFATLLLGILIVFAKPEVKKVEPKSPFELVRTDIFEREDFQTYVTGFGTVEADKEVQINVEVSGKILYLSPKFVKGGHVKEGETLLNIDPRNFQTQVELQKASLARAEAELKIELGRQIVAEKEWEEFGSKDAEQYQVSQELVLRKPQVKEKEAAVEAAKSSLYKAELDLERTELRAPFDAIITEENVEVGQYITPQANLGRLVASNRFRVQVNLPYDRVSLISEPSEDEEGSFARISYDSMGGPLFKREGKVMRVLPDLTPGGRTARVLVGIENPLSLKGKKEIPLLLGSYVRVEIEGPLLEGVFVLPRNYLRQNDTIWVNNGEGRLEVRQVEIPYKNSDTFAISGGLEEGEEVVTSSIPIPIDGMRLQVVEEERPDER